MDGLIKKGLLVGLGAVSLTRAKAQKIINELVKKKIMSRGDGIALLKKVLKEADNERKRIKDILTKEVKRELKKAKPLIDKAKIIPAKTEKIGRKVARKIINKAYNLAQKKLIEAVKKIRL